MADVPQPDLRRRVRDRFVRGVKDDDVSGLSAEIMNGRSPNTRTGHDNRFASAHCSEAIHCKYDR